MTETTNAAQAGETSRARASHKIDPNKKCAIVGFASSSRGLAPYNDPSIEIWGLNSLYALIPRWNRWFEIHPKTHILKDLHRAELQQIGVEHIEWLKTRPGVGQADYCPIMMQEGYPDIPASVAWPRAEINAWTREMFGCDGVRPGLEADGFVNEDYFTSTPGEMVVTAIFEGYGEIHLYGIDLLQDEEYAYQRPGCEYWIGVARGLGIKVYVPRASALMKANYVYGYSEPAIAFGAATPLVTFWEEKAVQIEATQQQAAAVLNTINGARQLLNSVKSKLQAVVTGEGKDEEAAAKAAIAGEVLKSVFEYLGLEEDNLSKRFEITRDELSKLVGQLELAKSAASWTGHFGRGGLLEGMPAPDKAAAAAPAEALVPAQA